MADEPGTDIIQAEVRVTDIVEADFERATRHFAELEKFTAEHMTEGLDFDLAYPSAPQKSLLQPGAERIRLLYNLTVETPLHEKVLQLDGDRPFAYFSHDVIVRTADGRVIWRSEGVASCNSAEKKYRKESVFDVLNTVQQMSAKRAFVSGVRHAPGASRYFTQDEGEPGARRQAKPRSVREAVQSQPQQPKPEPRRAKATRYELHEVHRLVSSVAFWDSRSNAQDPWPLDKKAVIWGEHLSATIKALAGEDRDWVSDKGFETILEKGTYFDSLFDAGMTPAQITDHLKGFEKGCLLLADGPALHDLDVLLKDQKP